MKYIIIPIFFCFLGNVSFAQNLVPNYSFEEADSCPTFLNARTYKYSLGCVGWGQANTGNPDYYNTCDTAAISIGKDVPWVGVPYNYIGYQAAYEGAAYAGINMYIQSPFDNKEYLITNIPALEVDTVYQVTIHVSLADSCEYATDGMGVFFTTYGSPDQLTSGTIIETPQIDYTSYGIIKDSINWVTLSGIFIADSAYTSLIIGGFKSSSEMNIIAVNDSPSNPHTNAYYYIDNVVVEKLSSTRIGTVNKTVATQLYPNPFTDYATLLFNNPDKLNCSFSLFNAQGQVVQRMDNVVSDRLRIERNELPTGVYYYQLINATYSLTGGKVIIK